MVLSTYAENTINRIYQTEILRRKIQGDLHIQPKREIKLMRRTGRKNGLVNLKPIGHIAVKGETLVA